MKNEITYIEKNGINYPELSLPEQSDYTIGKYGQMRLNYIKEHRRGTYITLLTECRLNAYLYEIDEEARERVNDLVEAFKDANGITEKLKATDPLRWVQEMNNAKASAEEVVQKEVIFR